MRVWIFPQLFFRLSEGFFIPVQIKVSMCHRDHSRAMASRIEPPRTHQMLDCPLGLSKPYVDPAAIHPGSRKIWVQLKSPIDQLLCQREVSKDTCYGPRSLAQSHAVVLSYPHHHLQ